MHLANGGQRYNVTLSLIGGAHTQNDPCYTDIMLVKVGHHLWPIGQDDVMSVQGKASYITGHL